MLCVVVIAGLAGAWIFLRPGGGEPAASSRLTLDQRDPVRSPSPAAEAVKLRPITGDQLCAAVPDSLRKSLVTDGRYGGKELSGLGEKAFAVISTTTRPGKEPMREVLVKVLVGDRTAEFAFRGTTIGGGIIAADDYQKPVFESSVAQHAVAKLAKTFVAGLT
ncbi:hypothetical protein ACQEVF_52335 [Nonomuraea polychroma]|uniref:hypothetical protein n=1 Tax=Nonomuraea polychroma TaxID=46176 RepID=UPI003D8B6777